MAENFYKEAFEYAMKSIYEEFTKNDKEDEFKIWFDINYQEDSIDSLTVSVATSFLKTMLQKKGYLDILQNKINEITNQKIELVCIVKQIESKSSNENKKNDENKIQTKEISLEIFGNDTIEKSENENLNKEFKKHPLLQEFLTFESFIPGDNSNFAYNASIAVAKNPGKKYNPILLYGNSGLGKTHLMQAIGNYIYNNGGEKLKINYVSAESFTNEFINSTKEKNPNIFTNKYRNLDVLLLDDIHFLKDKDATQEALFYTFNALKDKNAQMVFTCDRPIKEIKNMSERLVSRLANGLCIDLQPPSYETRIAILQKKLEEQEKSLSQEIIEFIAKNIENNVRELEAALNKVLGYEELIGKKLSLDVVKNQLRDLLSSAMAENISLDIIQKTIADEYQISITDLKSKKRDKKFVVPRQIAIYIARELTEISYTELGNEFGGKDHSTIMHAYEKIADQIKIDPSMESKIQLFIRKIKNANSMN